VIEFFKSFFSFFKNLSVAKLQRAALSADAWFDTTLYTFGQRISTLYEKFSLRTDKLTLSGGQRLCADLASETVSLVLVGAFILLSLAVPAFQDTTEDWLKRQQLAVSFTDRYGRDIGNRGIRHDDSVPLEQFPDHLIKAVLATEDRRFFDHFGIDPIGTARALTVNARASGVVQGGSSLTQQLAKNLFLSNERSVERKIREAFLAVWLEWRLSKQQILKLYLDRAYMGGGVFGITAASEYYFGKFVRDLNLAESAMLAGLFKAPARYAPHVNLPAARARAQDVLSNLVEAKFMTAGQIESARRNPATPIERQRESSPDYYLDWAFSEIKKLSDTGKLGQERVLTVKTAFDPNLNNAAETALENTLRQHGANYNASQAAMVVMEPEGAVRAMIGGRDYNASQFNRAVDSLRQPGSAFKPFVYTAALSAGLYRPNSVVTDTPVCIGNWCPSNYSRSHAGSMPLTTALAKSINTIPVRMSLQLGNGNAKLGRVKIVDTARKMGITSELKDSTSLPIGSAEVTVLDMTAAYAVFANGGRRADPFAALEIHNSQGKLIWQHSRDAAPLQQIISASVIADMNYMLSKVPEEGTGRRAALENIKSAGKTGTTNAYKDAWYAGFTGNFVSAVWFGNDDSSPTENMTGGSLPAMAWHDVMTVAHRDVELRQIPGLFGGNLLTEGQTPVASGTAATQTPTVLRTGTGLQEISGITQNGVNASALLANGHKRTLRVLNDLSDLFGTNTPKAQPVKPNASLRKPQARRAASRTFSEVLPQTQGKRGLVMN
jgi:penicillin-binding protein 1A